MCRAAPLVAVIVCGGILALARTSPAAPIAFDHAGDQVYNDGWQEGDNGGFGFGAWSLEDAVLEILSSSRNNADPPPPPGGDIDSVGNGSWAFRTVQPPRTGAAIRPLAQPLRIGQTIALDFDSNMGPNEVSGVSFGGRIAAFDYGVNFRVEAAGTLRFIGPPEFAREGLHLEFTLTGPDSYQLSYETPDTGPEMITGLLGGPPGRSIDSVIVFTDSPHWSYVNNVTVIPEPGILMCATTWLAIVQRRRRPV